MSEIYNDSGQELELVEEDKSIRAEEDKSIRAELKKFVRLCKDSLPDYIDKQDAARTNFAGNFVRDQLTLDFNYICFCSLLGERISSFLTGPAPEELSAPDGTVFTVLKPNGMCFFCSKLNYFLR